MFAGWDNYFLMLGGAAGSLIGLLFVVVTLTANFERSQALKGASIYMTPTAAHFAVALAICAVALAPGLSRDWQAALLALAVVSGLANALRAALGIHQYEREPDSNVHWSDFWWYGATPTALYACLAAAVAAVWLGAGQAVYVLAAGVLMLVLVAIHNAWDLITWIAPRGSVNPRDVVLPGEPPPPQP